MNINFLAFLFLLLIGLGAWVSKNIVEDISIHTLDIQKETFEPNLVLHNIMSTIYDLQLSLESSRIKSRHGDVQSYLKKINRLNREFSENYLHNYPFREYFKEYIAKFKKLEGTLQTDEALLNSLKQLSELKLLMENMDEYSYLDGKEKIQNFSNITKKKMNYLLGFFMGIFLLGLVVFFYFKRKMKQAYQKIKEKEVQVFQSSRLASLGEMAGGVAHEINNPLAIISASLQMLKKAKEKEKLTDAMLLESFEGIESTVARITKIVSGLTTLSRKASDNYSESILLRDMFSDVLGVCGEKFKTNGVELDIDLESSIFDKKVIGERVQLSQVFVNLLGNAYDAIEELEDKWIRLEVSEEKSYQVIRVTDSGSGVPMKIQSEVFNPFYTTKEIGKGTGLGLSISKNIISRCGGSLEIDNNCTNTCFIVKLLRSNNNEVNGIHI